MIYKFVMFISFLVPFLTNALQADSPQIKDEEKHNFATFQRKPDTFIIQKQVSPKQNEIKLYRRPTLQQQRYRLLLNYMRDIRKSSKSSSQTKSLQNKFHKDFEKLYLKSKTNSVSGNARTISAVESLPTSTKKSSITQTKTNMGMPISKQLIQRNTANTNSQNSFNSNKAKSDITYVSEKPFTSMDEVKKFNDSLKTHLSFQDKEEAGLKEGIHVPTVQLSPHNQTSELKSNILKSEVAYHSTKPFTSMEDVKKFNSLLNEYILSHD